MKRMLEVLLLILLFVVPANAQSFRGAINGTLTDSFGRRGAGRAHQSDKQSNFY